MGVTQKVHGAQSKCTFSVGLSVVAFIRHAEFDSASHKELQQIPQSLTRKITNKDIRVLVATKNKRENHSKMSYRAQSRYLKEIKR